MTVFEKPYVDWNTVAVNLTGDLQSELWSLIVTPGAVDSDGQLRYQKGEDPGIFLVSSTTIKDIIGNRILTTPGLSAALSKTYPPPAPQPQAPSGTPGAFQDNTQPTAPPPMPSMPGAAPSSMDKMAEMAAVAGTAPSALSTPAPAPTAGNRRPEQAPEPLPAPEKSTEEKNPKKKETRKKAAFKTSSSSSDSSDASELSDEEPDALKDMEIGIPWPLLNAEESIQDVLDKLSPGSVLHSYRAVKRETVKHILLERFMRPHALEAQKLLKD